MTKLLKARNKANRKLKDRRSKSTKCLLVPQVSTWSSKMPPYCYTTLCPDVRYQLGYVQEVILCAEDATPAYAGRA